MITMMDNGRSDEKIIAIPFNDPNYNMYTDISQLPFHIFEEMRHFFTVYKALERKETAVKEVQDRDAAIEIIKQCIERYKECSPTRPLPSHRARAPPDPSASTGSELLRTCRTCWGLASSSPSWGLDSASAPGLLCSSLSE